MTDEHRLEALKVGCESIGGANGWIRPEPRGIDCTSRRQLIKALRLEIFKEDKNVEIFNVMGADTAQRFPSEIQKRTVIINRTGSGNSWTADVIKKEDVFI